jgi:hypothetical protein
MLFKPGLLRAQRAWYDADSPSSPVGPFTVPNVRNAKQVDELKGLMSGAGSLIANPALIATLSTKLAGIRTVNDALRSAGLPHGGVPAGKQRRSVRLAF